MSSEIASVEPSDSARETSRGLRTLGTTIGLDLIIDELTPEQIARVWNRHLATEGKETLQLTGASKSRIAQSFTDFRRVLRDAFRRNLTKSVDLTPMSSGELASRVRPAPGVPETTAPSSVDVVTPAPKPVPAKVGRALSPLEQRMFVASAKAGNVAPEQVAATATDTALDPEVAELLAKAADEAQAQGQLKSDYILWACNRADEIQAAYNQREGEALWTNPILVESFPGKPDWKAVFVCSSTAPLIRDPSVASPNVKHDFRANEVPVTHAHPLAFKQADGMKIIRSKVIKKGSHEYYVKALEYVDGTFFKGYFVVDGVEDAQAIPPRYYQIQGMKVVRLTEQEYQACQNRLAAKKPLRAG